MNTKFQQLKVNYFKSGFDKPISLGIILSLYDNAIKVFK